MTQTLSGKSNLPEIFEALGGIPLMPDPVALAQEDVDLRQALGMEQLEVPPTAAMMPELFVAAHYMPAVLPAPRTPVESLIPTSRVLHGNDHVPAPRV